MNQEKINFTKYYIAPSNIIELLKSLTNMYNIKDVIITYFNNIANVAIKEI